MGRRASNTNVTILSWDTPSRFFSSLVVDTVARSFSLTHSCAG
jgi:hypothetical protein